MRGGSKRERTKPEKVKEILHGSSCVEIFMRDDHVSGNTFYDYRVNRRFEKRDGTIVHFPYLQQRDLRDTVRCLMDAMEWIAFVNKKTDTE